MVGTSKANNNEDDSIIDERVIEEKNIEKEKPKIAETALKSKLLIIPVMAIAVFLVYKLFIADAFKTPPERQEILQNNSDDAKVAEKIEDKKQIEQVLNEPAVQVEIPPPPPPEKLELSPPTVTGFGDISSSTGSSIINTGGSQSSGQTSKDQELQTKISINSVIVAGAGGATSILDGSSATNSDVQNGISDSSAANVVVTKVKDPFNTIIQGKLIDVVLETAIYTELNGVLRAVVAQDVYAERGKKILIPKGSRLIGSYNTDVAAGQTRIFIIWSRVIRPDGVDAQIGSPVTDLQGRAGLVGKVDNKYLELFSSSLLSSLITIGVAAAAEGAFNTGNIESRETTGGSTFNSGGAKDYAVVDAVQGITDLTKSIAKDQLSVKRAITVDQGERIKVFVNKDIIFPSSAIIENNNIFR